MHSSQNLLSERMSVLLTRAEVAARLRVHPLTLRRWTRAGRLPTVQLSAHVVRYREEDVERIAKRYLSQAGQKRGPKPRQKIAA